MDLSKFLGKFRDATRDHLRRMNELLLRLEQEPGSEDSVTELMREIHTLKGEARMMGASAMADLAHATEDLLKAQEAARFEGLASVIDLLFAVFDDTDRLLREMLGEAPAEVDVAARCRALRTAAGLPPEPEDEPVEASDAPPVDDAPSRALSMQPLPELPSVASPQDEGLDMGDLGLEEDEDDGDWEPPPPDADVDPEAALREAFGLQAGVAQEIGEGGAVAAPGERAVSVGGSSQKFVARYRDVAQERLRALQAALTALGRSADDTAALGTLADEASALADESRQLGFDDAALLAHGCAAVGAVSDPARVRASLGAVADALEALGRIVAERLGGPPANADVGTLLERLAEARPPEGETPVSAPARAGGGTVAAQSAPVAPVRGAVEETIRVSVGRLDRLGMLSSDIYLSHASAETRLRHLRGLLEQAKACVQAVGQARSALGAAGAAGGAVSSLIPIHDELLTSARALRRGVRDVLRVERDELLRSGHAVVELRERVRELQVLPVSTLFDLYPRMVRDLARDLGKQVKLVIEGGDRELDRRVLDEIRDPMVHLLRNAIDHGIESPSVRQAAGKPAAGTLTLSARADGDHVVIEVRDDGAGIDPAAIRRVAVARGVLSADEVATLSDERAMDLIFNAGFSSRDAVTDVSGRGVGLDVVRERVDRLEGTLSVWSVPGQGTRFVVRLPLTLAMARLILARAGGLLVGLPAALVDEVLPIHESQVRRVEGYEAVEWSGRAVPLVSLAGLLDRDPETIPGANRHVAVVHVDEHVVALVVDAFAGEREAVVKRPDPFLGKLRHVAGATILTTGEVVTVLHVPQIIAATMGVEPARLQARVRVAAEAPARKRRLLVVDDSIIVRDMMKSVLVAAGFEVTLAVDGQDGLDKQTAGGYDAVVTDVEMPRMTGLELVRTLRQIPAMARVPIVMVTTLDSPEAREEGMRAGASAYLVKNLLDMRHLVATIERLLG